MLEEHQRWTFTISDKVTHRTQRQVQQKDQSKVHVGGIEGKGGQVNANVLASEGAAHFVSSLEAL